MKNLKSIERTARALQYIGSEGQEENILEFIGPGSQFLRFKFEKAIVGRTSVMVCTIASGKRTWRLEPGEWLVIFDDGNMEVMIEERIKLYFEETE